MTRRVVPARVREWVQARRRRYRLQWPRTGTVALGDLHRLTPVSAAFGVDRGLPVDRYYVERFLAARAHRVAGRVLEIGDDRYTRQFGGPRVEHGDVLHVTAGNPQATIVADLARADHLPGALFDCIICTQTMQMIYDVRAALRHLHRLLRPGGILLATTAGIARIGRREGVDPWGEYWHLTSQSARRLFSEVFEPGRVEVRTYGNVLTAVAFLHGLAAEELTPAELDYVDPDYEVLIGIAAERLDSGPELR
jgi:SAM-dependent methyltransferase